MINEELLVANELQKELQQEASKAKEYKDEAQPLFFQEVSRADSYMYEKYLLRPYNPDDLFQKKGNYDLFDTMREDDQISACLMLKKLMILGQWEIECEDEKVKEQLEWNLKDGLDELFEKKLLNILTAKDYGFSVTEKIFEYIDTPKWGRKIIISKLKTRAPHSFEFDQDSSGNVTTIRQSQSKGDDIKLEPKKVIHYINNKEFDNPYGKADFASIGVYRAWFSKDNIIKYWAMFLEKFGSPTAVGTYAKSMTNQKDAILKVLKRIQQNTAIVIPEGIEVELLEAMKSGSQKSDYENAINRFDKMITIAMLQPDKMGMSGETVKGGSFALGKEQFGMYYELVNTDKKQLARLINREVINPLVMWNYGTSVEASFKFIQVDQAKKNEQFKIWLDAIQKGKIMTSLEQWNHFLQGIDFPEINEAEWKEDQAKKEEDRLDKKENEPNRFQQPIQDINQGGGKADKVPKEKLPPKEKPIKDIKKQTKDYADYFRKPTVYESKVELKKIDRGLDKIEDTYKTDIADAYKLSINALADEIRSKKIIERKRLDIINKLQLKHQAKIERLIRDMMIDSGKLGVETAHSEVPQKYYIIDDVPPLGNDDLAVWLTEHASYVSSMESGFILGKVKPILSEAIREGSSTKEAMELIDEALKGYDIHLDANRIENIVRTNTSKAFNEGRTQEFSKVKEHIPAYQFSAILDGRTSSICEALDKTIFRATEMSTYQPPLHFMCRSLIVAIFEDEEFELSEIPPTEPTGGGFRKLV